MKKFILATVLVTASATVLAWGPKEQAALTGLAIGIGASALANQSEHGESRYNYHRPQPVYVQPQPMHTQPYQPVCGYNVWCPAPVIQQSCFQQQVINQYGQVIGVRTVCN